MARDRTLLDRRRRASGALVFAAALLALAGCVSAPLPAYNLQPTHVRAPSRGASLSIDFPTAAPPLGSDLIVMREDGDRFARLPGARWVDQLPALVQNRALQSFENAGLARIVRANGGPAQQRLALEIRRFDIDSPTRTAKVEISARLLSEGGRIVAARVFAATQPVVEIAGSEPPWALDKAFGEVMAQIVGWTAAR